MARTPLPTSYFVVNSPQSMIALYLSCDIVHSQNRYFK